MHGYLFSHGIMHFFLSDNPYCGGVEEVVGYLHRPATMHDKISNKEYPVTESPLERPPYWKTTSLERPHFSCKMLYLLHKFTSIERRPLFKTNFCQI